RFRGSWPSGLSSLLIVWGLGEQFLRLHRLPAHVLGPAVAVLGAVLGQVVQHLRELGQGGVVEGGGDALTPVLRFGLHVDDDPRDGVDVQRGDHLPDGGDGLEPVQVALLAGVGGARVGDGVGGVVVGDVVFEAAEEGGSVDVPAAGLFGGEDGAHAAPGAHGGGGDVCEFGGVGGGEGGGHRGLLPAHRKVYPPLGEFV